MSKEGITWGEYAKLLPIARQLFKVTNKDPTTAQETANMYNIVGGIVRTLHNHLSKEKINGKPNN